MKRRRRQVDSSLEMLLVVMTNAFGGVLFLAILISIQLKDRVFSDTVVVDTEKGVELIRLAGRRDVLSLRLEGLEQQLQEARSADTQSQAELDPSQLEALQMLDEEQRNLIFRREELNRQIDEQNEKLSNTRELLEQKLMELGQKEADAIRVSELQSKLTASRAELASERERRTISGRLPVLRYEPGLRRFDVILRYGKIYFPIVRGAINYDSFSERSGGLFGSQLIARPEKGIPVQEFAMNPSFPGANPHDNSLTIFVWENTFEDFQDFKRIIVKAGFKYRIDLMRDSDELARGGGWGVASPVQ